ncbi:MAG: glycosyltransferase [Candidatus Omnitrophica bacterium]|nr:glycosyltransferase [Candidatus Omnitrophota bacterium]
MSKKIKVVQLIPGIAFGGGAENVVYNLCRFIDRSRFELEVFYWNDYDDLAANIRQTGSRTVKLPLKKVVSLLTVRTIARMLEETKADILHTHFIDSDSLGFLASRLARVPMVAHVHRYPYPELPRHAVRYRVMAVGMRKIVCVSAHVRDHMQQATGLPPEKFEVIYNGIDREAFTAGLPLSSKQALKRSLGLGKDDFVIGNVSRLIADKGHDCLLKAFLVVLMRKPQVRLLIVGEGPLHNDLRALARRLGIADHVVFAGKRTDVPDLLACMDIFAFPTFTEAFGLCLVEAMAAGLPVISTDDGAAAEIIHNGQDGILVRPGDEQGLAQSILRLMDEPGLAQKLASAGCERSREFTVEAMVRRLESFYEAAVRT